MTTPGLALAREQAFDQLHDAVLRIADAPLPTRGVGNELQRRENAIERLFATFRARFGDDEFRFPSGENGTELRTTSPYFARIAPKAHQ